MDVKDTTEGRVVVFSKDEIYISNAVYNAALANCINSLEPIATLLRTVDISRLPYDSLKRFIVVLNLRTKQYSFISSIKGPNYLYQVGDKVVDFNQFFNYCDSAGPKMKRLLKL